MAELSEGARESAKRAIFDHAKRDKDGKWMTGPRITATNLKEGSGSVEHIAPEEFFKGGGKPGTAKPASKPKPSTNPDDPIGFGKWKDRTLRWVHDNDRGYWRWLCENVRGFEARGRAAGLS